MESMFRMSGGSEFQSLGAERLKARDPMVERRAGGMMRLREVADLRDRVGVLICMRSDRYEGARLGMALDVRRRVILIVNAVFNGKPVKLL